MIGSAEVCWCRFHGAQPTELQPPARLHVMTDGCGCLHLWSPARSTAPTRSALMRHMVPPRASSLGTCGRGPVRLARLRPHPQSAR